MTKTKFYVTGLDIMGDPCYGECISTDINSAVHLLSRFGCGVLSIKKVGTLSSEHEDTVNLTSGKPKPKYTVCGKCQHCRITYRETADQDIEVLHCNLRKEQNDIVDYNGFCSLGIGRAENEH